MTSLQPPNPLETGVWKLHDRRDTWPALWRNHVRVQHSGGQHEETPEGGHFGARGKPGSLHDNFFSQVSFCINVLEQKCQTRGYENLAFPFTVLTLKNSLYLCTVQHCHFQSSLQDIKSLSHTHITHARTHTSHVLSEFTVLCWPPSQLTCSMWGLWAGGWTCLLMFGRLLH